MTEQDLDTLIRENPRHGIPCLMLDGHVALLRRPPAADDVERRFGFETDSDHPVRWVAPGNVAWAGNTLTEIMPAVAAGED
jgi:prepilin-type processing-associated H-X9-DG protein